MADKLVEGTARGLPKATQAQLSTFHVQRLAKWTHDEGWRVNGNSVPLGAREVRNR